jgi:hypothetical protein
MCYGALGIGVLMSLIFLLDLIVGFPFGRAGGDTGNPFVVADVLGLLSSGIVAYLGWNAARDLK